MRKNERPKIEHLEACLEASLTIKPTETIVRVAPIKRQKKAPAYLVKRYAGEES